MYHAEEIKVGSVVEAKRTGKTYVVTGFHPDKIYGTIIELQDEEDLGQLEYATYRDIKLGYSILSIEPEESEEE